MTGFTLRDYQDDAIEAVRHSLARERRAGRRGRVVLTSPTGSGKTVLTAHMIRGALDRNLSSWFIVHRSELAAQTSKQLWASGVSHGRIQAGRPQSGSLVQVATIQTLQRRIEKLPVRPNMLVIDEAHHAAARTYKKVIDACPDSYVIGLTATPERSDGAGLSDMFDDLVLGPEVGWLIEHGYLAPYRIIAPKDLISLHDVKKRHGDYIRSELETVVDQSTVWGDAIKHYKRFVGDGTCLVYCVTRRHARHVEAAYREAGIDARYCAGDTPKEEREAIIEGFRDGNPRVIVSVDLFGEGLDVPRLDAVQLLRPTQSLSLHLQQIGRALRPDGRKVAIILDHVGNTFRHGLPDDARSWSLAGRKGSKDAGEDVTPLLHCPDCFSVFLRSLGVCPQCGWSPPATAEALGTFEAADGELVEIDPEEHRRLRLRQEREANDFEALVQLAVERKYKPGWAAYRQHARMKRKGGNVPPVEALRKLEYDIRRELRV